MISHKYKAIWIMPGKTGSVSLSTALIPYANINSVCNEQGDCFNFNDEFGQCTKHITISKIIQHYDSNPLKITETNVSRYTNIGVTRDPWARVVSKFLWLKQKTSRKKFSHIGFDEYVTTNATPPVMLPMFTHKGKMIMDLFIRHSLLRHDFDVMCRHVGLPNITLPHRNKSNISSNNYEQFYTDRTRQIVADKYKEDIDYFGYEFNAR